MDLMSENSSFFSFKLEIRRLKAKCVQLTNPAILFYWWVCLMQFRALSSPDTGAVLARSWRLCFIFLRLGISFAVEQPPPTATFKIPSGGDFLSVRLYVLPLTYQSRSWWSGHNRSYWNLGKKCRSHERLVCKVLGSAGASKVRGQAGTLERY